jgi:hypothetical protein
MPRQRPLTTATWSSSIALLILGLLLAVAVSARNPSARYTSRRLWGVKQPLILTPISTCLLLPRGGSEAPAEEEDNDEDDDDDDDDTDQEDKVEVATEPVADEGGEEEETKDKEDERVEEAEEDEEEDEDKGKKDITSMAGIPVLIKTNMNNKLVDHTVELNAVRTRNVESIKKSLSRQLPGKPPLAKIRLMQHGQVLRDEVLVDELMDDDDEEEDEGDEEGNASLTLFLDMVPPVDPRYPSQLEEALPDMTTAELLDAYTLNEAAIWYSSQEMAKAQESGANEDEEEPSIPAPSPLVSFQLRQYASALKAQLEESLFSEKVKPLLEDPLPPAKALLEKSKEPEVKGLRTRVPTASGGPSSSVVGLRQTVQHYLNIVSTQSELETLFLTPHFHPLTHICVYRTGVIPSEISFCFCSLVSLGGGL